MPKGELLRHIENGYCLIKPNVSKRQGGNYQKTESSSVLR